MRHKLSKIPVMYLSQDSLPGMTHQMINTPSTRGKDQVKKLNVYLDGGVNEYWIIDPRDCRVTLYYFVDKQLEDLNLFRYPDVVTSIHFPFDTMMPCLYYVHEST